MRSLSMCSLLCVLCVLLPLRSLGLSNCSCNQTTVQCLYDCSPTFCLCDDTGFGTVMSTVNGTVCRNGTQVWESECTNNTHVEIHQEQDCACETIGVNCVGDCSTSMCMCGSNTMRGSLVPVANNTLCYKNYLTWSDDARCSPHSGGTHPAVCDKDGFECTSPCSITYSYCSNGIRYPKQFVPFGTVCTTGGELVYPNQCDWNSQSLVPTCDTEVLSLKCYTQCSPLFYYCQNYTTYVLQNAPPGLVCYNDAFIMSNQPVCDANHTYAQAFPISIRYQNSTVPWSSLTEYALASAMSDALLFSGTLVHPSDIYFSTVGRRLSETIHPNMFIRSTDTHLAHAVQTALQQHIQMEVDKRNLAMVVSMVANTLSPTPSVYATPSAISVPGPVYATPSAISAPVLVSSTNTLLLGLSNYMLVLCVCLQTMNV